MGRRREEKKPDRFLFKRASTFHYMRRVPAEVAALDDRAPMVRLSLKTGDLQKAMAIRDIHERADNDYWASMIVGSDSEVATRRYKAAVSRATALGFTYRSAADIASYEPSMVAVERIEAVKDKADGSIERKAVLGLASGSDETITAAMDIYINTIARDEIRNKSPEQKRIWSNIKKQAVATFAELCGDKTMADISRDDARKVHSFWMDRIAPKTGRATHSASSGNKQMNTLRVLYREWFGYHGEMDRQNPFAGLSFSEVDKKSRPPFSVKWITDTLLAPKALSGLNAEARGVFLAMVETGARLSEICNLKSENIILGGDHPHIKIEPSEDPDEPREIKTKTSIRIVPLVGISLAAMKKHRKGFPRYHDKGSSLSATLNKFLTDNELLETPKHSVYSLRHSMEDRMKDGGFDHEMRMILMGHKIDRPKYGKGGSLEWKHDALSRIALPFDPKIV